MADVTNYVEIMRNKDVSEPVSLAKLDEQIHDLRLDGDVQGGYRFISDNYLRLYRQRPGNTDPLPLPAAKGVRQLLLQLRR